MRKQKTTNNGSFLKLFKTLAALVLSSLKCLNLIKHCGPIAETQFNPIVYCNQWLNWFP